MALKLKKYEPLPNLSVRGNNFQAPNITTAPPRLPNIGVPRYGPQPTDNWNTAPEHPSLAESLFINPFIRNPSNSILANWTRIAAANISQNPVARTNASTRLKQSLEEANRRIADPAFVAGFTGGGPRGKLSKPPKINPESPVDYDQLVAKQNAEGWNPDSPKFYTKDTTEYIRSKPNTQPPQVGKTRPKVTTKTIPQGKVRQAGTAGDHITDPRIHKQYKDVIDTPVVVRSAKEMAKDSKRGGKVQGSFGTNSKGQPFIVLSDTIPKGRIPSVMVEELTHAKQWARGRRPQAGVPYDKIPEEVRAKAAAAYHTGPKVTAKTPPPKPPKVTMKTTAPEAPPVPLAMADRGAGITKPFLSTSGYLSRFGPEGKTLDKLVNKRYEVSRDFAQKWYSSMPVVAKLRGGDKKDFGLAVQGITQPRNAKVAQAVAEWKAVSSTIRRDFMRASGEDLGNIPNFFPRMLKREYLKPNSSGYNAAIKHLVDTKQAKNAGDAVRILGFVRRANLSGDVLGSFRYSRKYNLPPEMYDTSTDALSRYLQGAADHVAGARVFGMDKSGTLPVANDLIASIAKRGGNAEQVKRTFEQAMGLVRYGENATKVSNVIRGVNVTTKLGLGAITNSAQTINAVVKNGYIDSLKGLGYLATPAGRTYARDTGAFTYKLIHDLREASGIVTRGSKVGAPFFNSVEKWNRYFSATGGKFHAERLARRVNSGGPLAARAERDLRQLGVEGPIGSRLTPKQLSQAGRGTSDITQFVVAEHTLPGWASTPVGKLIVQFQTFSYKQTGFVANQVLKPLAGGNPLPLMRLLAALPVGYGIYNVKDLIRLKDDSSDTTAEKVIKTFRAIGGIGTPGDIAQNIKDAATYNSGTGFAPAAVTKSLGPTVSTVLDTINSAYQGARGNAKPAEKQALKTVPVLGPTLANRLTPSKKPAVGFKEGAEPTSIADIKKAALSGAKVTVDGKEIAWNSLKDEQKRQLALTDPDARDFYDKERSIDQGLTKPGLYAPDLNPESAKVLDKFARMTSSTREKYIESHDSAEYDLAVAKFENDDKSGKITDPAERMSREQDLQKLKVGTKFKKEYRDLYNSEKLNRQEMYDYIDSIPNGKKTFEQILAYGDALVKAGIIKKNKFRDKYGNLLPRDSDSSSGKKVVSKYRYAVSRTAGGAAPSTSVKFQKSNAPRVAATRISKPKVTLTKSRV